MQTTSQCRVWVGVEGPEALVRVAGRANFAFGQDLRQFVVRMRDSGVRRFRFDVHECASMDSTFIGILAMAATEGGRDSVTVEIVNANAKVHDQIAGLGIAGLFAFSESAADAAHGQPLNVAVGSAAVSDAVRQTIVRAHETLGRANPENVDRFKDLLGLLRTEPPR
jgi:anti-sigma B factor antagonist